MKGKILENLTIEYNSNITYREEFVPSLVKSTLPIHPDYKKWASEHVGEEVEFYGAQGEEVTAKLVINKPTPVRSIKDIPEDLRHNYRGDLLKEIMKDDEELGLYDSKNYYTEEEVEDLLWKFNEYPDTLEHLDFAILLDEDEFNKFWEQNKKK